MNTSNGTDIAPSCSRLWLSHILNSAVDADPTYSLHDTQPLPSIGAAYPPILDSRKFCGKESIDQEVVTADLRGHGRSGRPTSPDADQSKIFVDDFKTVMDAFGLGKPILAAWSMGAAVATDVAAHLPPATLSGVIYLAGVPSTGEMMSPTVGAALSGLLSTDDVFAFQASSAIFAEKLFAQPDTVPYATKCLYMGHRLPPEIIKSSLDRPMDLQPLWTAGR